MKVYLLFKDQYGSDPNTEIEDVFAKPGLAEEARAKMQAGDSRSHFYVEEWEVQE